MVIVNYLSGIHTVPTWLKHAPGTGLTFVDVIAPAFLFAIGLTYRLSLERRLARDGRSIAFGHFLRRWFTLIGIGAVLSAGAAVTGEGIVGATGHMSDWGVLQAIGVAGLLTLPLVRRPVWIRLVAACVLLAFYQFGHDLFLADHVAGSSHGGLWGSIAWTAVLILSTCVAGLSHRPSRRRPDAIVVAPVGLIAAGLLLSLVVPISKSHVSASYVLVTVGISGLIYEFFRLAGDVAMVPMPPLVWWGRNPLLLYVFHQILLGLVVLPGVNWWYADASPLLIVTQAVFILGALTVVSWWLYRKRVVVSL